MKLRNLAMYTALGASYLAGSADLACGDDIWKLEKDRASQVNPQKREKEVDPFFPLSFLGAYLFYDKFIKEKDRRMK